MFHTARSTRGTASLNNLNGWGGSKVQAIQVEARASSRLFARSVGNNGICTMGNPRKPPALKLLAGTERKDRADPPDVPQFEQVRQFPPAPQHLNPDGMNAWNDLGPKLVAAGVLQEVDLYPLEQLCYTWQLFRQKAKAGMDMTASDNNALKALFSEFGMTPAARRRVAANLLDPDAQTPKGNAFAGIGKRSA